MSKSYFEIESSIEIAVEGNKQINLISYALSEDMEKKLELVVEKILERFSREDLKSTIYTCVKELAINGTKANIKKIFFDELTVNYEDPDDYDRGIEEFKKNFSEQWLYQYGKKAKEAGYFVKIKFFYDEHGMRIEITNNVPIKPIDELRIREKLAMAMKYDDIAQFYIENADNTEGEGIGIALVVLLLKAENIDPQLFRIGIIEQLTTARVEIPFSEKFQTIRKTKTLAS
jgi:hypothetical protein